MKGKKYEESQKKNHAEQKKLGAKRYILCELLERQKFTAIFSNQQVLKQDGGGTDCKEA